MSQYLSKQKNKVFNQKEAVAQLEKITNYG